MIKIGNIKEDFNRDLYWFSIEIKSDNKNKKTLVVACASWEYICDLYRINKVSDSYLKKWSSKVISDAKEAGDNIYRREKHYWVYVNTNEGKANGLKFLKEIYP